VTVVPDCFLDPPRLLSGPWSAFERDVARLLILHGFEDVRLVAGTGDHGADILGVKAGKLWVWQCKFSGQNPPPRSAIDEVVSAGEYYKAERLAIAVSRPATEATRVEIARLRTRGLQIRLAEPRELLGLAEECPEFPKSRRELRDYQVQAVEDSLNALLGTGRAQVVLATGLGKTVVAAELVSRMLADGAIPAGRVLVLAHTREIVSQLHRAFWHQLPRWVPTNQLSDGERVLDWRGVTFATVQGAMSNLHLLPDFDLVVVDEAHHIGAHQFQATIASLKPRFLLGATATPWRGDGYDIDQLLGAPVVSIGISEGLRRGFLSDVDYRLLADNLNWEEVSQLSTNNYSLPELNRRLIIPTRDEQAARIIRDTFSGDGRTGAICYSPSVVHAIEFAGMLRHLGLRAEAVSAETPSRDRDALMARFRAGALDAVTTVDLFNEGVDVPDVDLLVFMRVTHSRRIFVQQLGRGLRLKKSGHKVIVLDFVTDLRRVAEVLVLDREVRGVGVESLGLGSRVVQFSDAGAGSFLREWALDQASLVLRQDEPSLEPPDLDFPVPAPPGGLQ